MLRLRWIRLPLILRSGNNVPFLTGCFACHLFFNRIITFMLPISVISFASFKPFPSVFSFQIPSRQCRIWQRSFCCDSLRNTCMKWNSLTYSLLFHIHHFYLSWYKLFTLVSDRLLFRMLRFLCNSWLVAFFPRWLPFSQVRNLFTVAFKPNRCKFISVTGTDMFFILR